MVLWFSLVAETLSAAMVPLKVVCDNSTSRRRLVVVVNDTRQWGLILKKSVISPSWKSFVFAQNLVPGFWARLLDAEHGGPASC